MSVLESWLPIEPDSHFSLANFPFGIISRPGHEVPVPAVAVGDYALDLSTFAIHNGFSKLPTITEHIHVFSHHTLNAFAALGINIHGQVRRYLRDVFHADTPFAEILRENLPLQESSLVRLSDVKLHLPLEVGDYTDFFAGKNHAFNIGTLFRGPQNALQPNYTHLPVAYHGRASSVVVSGTPIRRPCGQILVDSKTAPSNPSFLPSRRLDIELELGMFVCKSNALGSRVSVEEARDYIFGYVLMNDWSARDIQQFEYVPLGPFIAKNFGTSISGWVVLAEALEPFLCRGIKNESKLQDYLIQVQDRAALDINLTVNLTTAAGSNTIISKTNSKHLLWSWPQMIAHHTVGGCPLRVGDLFGSGTISGTQPGTEGSLLEQNQGGKAKIQLVGGEERLFLEDADTVIIQGWAGEHGALVGFGQCSGMILPALPTHI